MTVIDVRRRGHWKRSKRRRVWADGVEITRRCFKMDRRRRRVWLFLADLSGHIVLHPHTHETIRYERRVKHLRVSVVESER